MNKSNGMASFRNSIFTSYFEANFGQKFVALRKFCAFVHALISKGSSTVQVDLMAKWVKASLHTRLQLVSYSVSLEM